MQTMEITEIYSHTSWQKFRESNSFTKWVTTELVSRKKFGESKFLSHCDAMHSVHTMEITEIFSHNFWQKFRESNVINQGTKEIYYKTHFSKLQIVIFRLDMPKNG